MKNLVVIAMHSVIALPHFCDARPNLPQICGGTSKLGLPHTARLEFGPVPRVATISTCDLTERTGVHKVATLGTSPDFG